MLFSTQSVVEIHTKFLCGFNCLESVENEVYTQCQKFLFFFVDHDRRSPDSHTKQLLRFNVGKSICKNQFRA